MTRVAAVDLGTNSARLLVADVDDGRVREVERRLRITRLGEDVDRRRRLLPTAIARVRNCLVDYRLAAEALGAERVLAVATSAVRDAENGEAFLGEIEWSYGFATRLLAGDEEALLSFRGVSAGREIAALAVRGDRQRVGRFDLDLDVERQRERQRIEPGAEVRGRSRGSGAHGDET